MADTFTPAERSRIMAAVLSRDTKPELIVRRIVHSLGYRYRLHDRRLPGTPDLVLPRLRKIINVSGCYWHGHTCGACRIPATNRAYWEAKIVRNMARDKRVARVLRKAGYRLFTAWECQTKPRKQDQLARRLLRFLEAE